MPVSTLPQEDIPHTASSIDEDKNPNPKFTEKTAALEDDDSHGDHDVGSDWKITIESTDGSTSEVNIRQKQIRISMIPDKPEQPAKSVVSTSAKEVTEGTAEAEKGDPSSEPIDPRKQRIWIIGQHAITALSSIIIIAIMIDTLIVFHKNANVDGAFPKNPILSPNIVMLSIACLNVTADVVTLGIHFCHGKTAITAGHVVHKIRTVLSIIQALGGAASAGYFKSAESLSGGADIWGFCCSDAATAKFAGMLCDSSRAAWALNLLQVTLHALSFAMAIWILFKPGQDLKTNIEEASHLLGQDEPEDKQDVSPPKFGE